jgi:hypothetical protein
MDVSTEYVLFEEYHSDSDILESEQVQPGKKSRKSRTWITSFRTEMKHSNGLKKTKNGCWRKDMILGEKRFTVATLSRRGPTV